MSKDDTLTDISIAINPSNVTSIYSYDQSALVYIGYHVKDKALVVVFRGTANHFNRYSDIVFDLEKVYGNKEIYVHKGFKALYESIIPELSRIFEEKLKKYSGAKICVTGHSLGGV